MKSKVLGVEFQFFEKNVLGRDGFGQNWIQDMNSMTNPDIKMRFLPMLEILRVIFFPSTLCIHSVGSIYEQSQAICGIKSSIFP